jgi:putative membrane protein
MGSEERWLHPASFVFALASHLKQLVLPGLVVLITAGAGAGDWQIWIMVLFVPYAIASIGRTLSYRYRFEPSELVIRTGFIFRNERHIPYARIQNIDAVQNIVHRLIGVASVRVETGASAEAEAQLTVVSLDAYEEIRRRVFAEREAVPGADGHAARPGGEPLLRLRPRDLAICGLIEGRGLVVIGTGFGLLWEAGLLDRLSGLIFGAETSGRGMMRQVVRAFFGLGSAPLGRIAAGVTIFALVLVAIRLLSVAWSFSKLYGFTLTRTGDDLRSEFGLLTRVASTIPVRRIQTLTVQEGPWHRLFGRVTVRVDTAGGEGEASQQVQRQVLAPVLPRSELPRFLSAVLPDEGLPVDWQPVHPRAFRRAFVGAAIVVTVVSAALIGMLKWYTPIALAILLGWAVVHARLYVKWLGWAVTAHAVAYRSGWLWRYVTVAPFAKIQVVAVGETPFDRRHRMGSVRVDTAGAGSSSHTIDIPYLAKGIAEDLAALLTSRAARTVYRW